ncbi:MAG: T9SS type A sorting domain-containing protein [Bacteroidetes bacterium]|nr:T9SS type A sorting domain-containing protein [Bacteroidota bacterium]MBU1718210.1 T9SS type A sorting domain-containing protein [Bacteroidota bacterium]
MKKLFVILGLALPVSALFPQTLNLPVRQPGALSGSQFVSLVTSYNITNRENEILNQVSLGNVPDFQRNLIPVTRTETVSSTSYTVTFYVLPDYLAIGCDTDYFLCPMSPLMAQQICDLTDCTMPTRDMVNMIWTDATVKLAPSTIPPSGLMTTIPVMNDHNTTVWGQRSAVIGAHPLGELVGGDKKDVVISNIIYGYPSPGRVVIYGWHQTNGTPIQPLYNGHEETYSDYSHGIRLVQNACLLNGNPTTVTSILQHATLNALLSDEGQISVPWYPTSPVVPSLAVPVSFAVIPESSTSLRIQVTNDAAVTHYLVKTSTDGVSFGAATAIPKASLVISGLSTDVPVYLKIAAMSGTDTSDYSEVLGAVPTVCSPKVLIVNGFDRATTGNTFNFVRQHGAACYNSGYGFASSTNEAVLNGLITLANYPIVDYILGEESTVNETFSSTEQTKVSDYLKSGGNLFVSGAEIAWDLDYKGAASDKLFYHDYLKAEYVNDAPGGVSASFYTASSLSGSIFDGVGDVSFDNGSHGTYDVKYPDVIQAYSGGEVFMNYTGVPSDSAAVCYSGIFPGGSVAGKVVNIGFPFESIYPESARNNVFGKILEYFGVSSTPPAPDVSQSNYVYCQFDSPDVLSATGTDVLWYLSDTSSSGSANAPNIGTTLPDTLHFWASQTENGCESDFAEIIIIVNPKPAQPVISQVGDTLFSSVPEGNEWYYNNVSTGDTLSWLKPDMEGYYTVVVAENGCASDSAVQVYVVISGISAVHTNAIRIFPNPVMSKATIELPDGEFVVRIYNVSGELLNESHRISGSYIIDAVGLPAGAYIIRFSENNGFNATIRFMVVK